MLFFINFSSCSYVNSTLTGFISLAYSARAVNYCRSRKVRPLYILHKVVYGTFGIIYSVNSSIHNLSEVMRRNISSHTDRYTNRTVYKKVRKARGKNSRLISCVIEVSYHRNNVLFYIRHHMVCHTAHSCFGITVRRSRVSVNVTEVSVSFYKSITQGKILRHSYHSAVNRTVSVRVVSTEHVTDCGCRFSERLIVSKIVLVHCVKNTSLSGLHSVSDVRKSTRGYYAH